jgi:uncharacterized membrane protein YhaH (DUF805 family)
MMSFPTAVKTGFLKYVEFSGRASRAEYWWFLLFTILVSVAFIGVAIVAFPEAERAIDIASRIGQLIFFLPTLSMSARRLHDIDKSGWNYLWGLLPIIGWIMIIIWFCRRGTPGMNRFGADPLLMSGNVAEVF